MNKEPELVAVKRLKGDAISSCLQDFEREIAIMKVFVINIFMVHLTYPAIFIQTLEHPNIVQIIGVIQEPEITLVMEFVQHGSLQSYLKIHQETLSQAQLLKFAHDVAKVCVKFVCYF
jgi:Janus kinase 2